MQQQQIRRLALFLGATAAFAGGMFVVACGTDNGDTNDVPTPQVDSGDNTNKKDAGGTKDSGNVDEEDADVTDPDADTTGGDADCSKAPKLRDNTKGFYCSFLPIGDAGADGGGNTGPYCDNDETCCNPADNADKTHNTSFCAPEKNGAAGCKSYAEAHAADGLAWPEVPEKPGSSWECADNVACGGAGWSCCMFTSSQYTDPKDSVNVGNSTDKTIPKECNAKQAFKQGGTHCVHDNACPAGDKTEIKLCSLSDANCPNGTTCTPFAGFFRDLGYCR